MKKVNHWGVIIALLIIAIILFILGYIGVSYKIKEDNKIKNAIIKVELKEDKTVEFDSKVKVSDFIISINGELVKDNDIDTTVLGEKNVSFKFTNEEGIIVPYSFKINIVDTVPPIIWLGNMYSVTTSYSRSEERRVGKECGS